MNVRIPIDAVGIAAAGFQLQLHLAEGQELDLSKQTAAVQGQLCGRAVRQTEGAGGAEEVRGADRRKTGGSGLQDRLGRAAFDQDGQGGGNVVRRKLPFAAQLTGCRVRAGERGLAADHRGLILHPAAEGDIRRSQPPVVSVQIDGLHVILPGRAVEQPRKALPGGQLRQHGRIWHGVFPFKLGRHYFPAASLMTS